MADFLVDVVALRRVGRADRDQELRGFERRQGLLGQRMAGGKILAVAKDRPQAARHRSGRRRPADEIGVDAELFQRRMQPFGPRLVAVAVAHKRAIFERYRFRHALPPGAGVVDAMAAD
jgi:hypothetical protein